MGYVRAPQLGAAILLTAIHMAHPSEALERPPPVAACRAWDRHIADLIEQHRFSDEVGEVEFFDVMRLFYDAKSDCDMGAYENELAKYGAIPIGRLKRQALR